MVDEFSSFARMPAPAMALHDLRKVISDAIVLQRTAFPQIAFSFAAPDVPVNAKCDARMIAQALTNVLKNAVEAIEARTSAAEGGRIELALMVTGENCTISVADNGIGLPQHERHRLTEPYVTTRAKGTGLGLAIVKKIFEDHGGALALADGKTGGAVVTLTLPVNLPPSVLVHAAQ